MVGTKSVGTEIVGIEMVGIAIVGIEMVGIESVGIAMYYQGIDLNPPQPIFLYQSIINFSEILAGEFQIYPLSHSPRQIFISLYFESMTKTLLPSPHNQRVWFWINITLFGVTGNNCNYY